MPVMPWDAQTVRDQFPTLDQEIHGHPLAYLDNAASTQKPVRVLEAMDYYYRHRHSNVHRGVHTLSQWATDDFEAARRRVRTFINAAEDAELIFTKGCTDALNLVASSWGRANLRPGEQVVLSGMEHHANIVPWQMAASQAGAEVVPIPVLADGQLDLDAYTRLLESGRVRMVGVVHVSNALGTINPIREMARQAHAVGAMFLADGAQALAHVPVDVRELGVDFYSLSAHKMYGPTGMGALYGRREVLESMPPYQGGGDMIRTVSWEKTTYNDLPNRFEPGTPNMAGAVGWGAAVDWLTQDLDRREAWHHEEHLMRLAMDELARIPEVKLIGTAPEKTAVVSFVVQGVHPHDLGTILDRHGVAVRAGHHCCMPLMTSLGLPATVRASFAVYNTEYDVQQLIRGVRTARDLFA